MSTLDLVLLAAYLAGMIGIGVWTRRRASSQEQYLLAGRSVGPVLYAGTLAAIIIGGGATIGGVKLGYLYGLSGMWLVVTYGMGMILMALLLVPRILSLRLYTITEILERRFGANTRIAGGVVMGIYDFMFVVVSTIAVGAVTEAITGISRTESILVCSAVMILYSAIGGMWALTLTDIVQFVIKTVGFLIILLPFAILHAGGLARMQGQLPAGFFSLDHIGWDKIVSFVTLYCLGIVLGQDGWQRVFTARSVAVARTGGMLVGVYCIVYAAAGALIGAAGRVFLPPLANADLAYAKVVQVVLPSGLRGLVLSASLAAIMSTATACLLASSTVFLEDVYLPLRRIASGGTVRQSRWLTVVLGILAALVAVMMHDVIAAMTIAYDLLVAALFVPIMMAIFVRSAPARVALPSIVLSTAVVLILIAVCGIDSAVPLYGGLALSTAINLGGLLAGAKGRR